MAFEEHSIKDARAEAESRMTREQRELVRPFFDAFEFWLLDVFAKSCASSIKYYSDRQVKVDRAMAAINYDLGEDGEEK